MDRFAFMLCINAPSEGAHVMRITVTIPAILFTTIAAQAGVVTNSKVVCSGKHPPAVPLLGGMLVQNSGVGEVDANIPPGFKVAKVYCQVSDPAGGLRACKYSKKPDKACGVASKGMLIDNFGDGFKELSWYPQAPKGGAPRLYILTTEIAPDTPSKKK
ncbi:hypothetical protein B1812_12100 [Methylocystis bryophila]|uniref:Uncharacterized protein n=2 Tax=Methylocystis bryophila TaxID=655015 RepID=A0A1W6MVS3_9HYPH|nr:hypothetical protein B1812_12100 [Methylocystis bryophila]